jgi:hypothetical protein
MAFASVVRITSARWGRFCFLVRDSTRLRSARRADRSAVPFMELTLGHGPAVDALARDELWIVSQPTYNEKIS